ncbi:3-oxoacyl-ACP reductase [Lottiidibacillus patelloidae]|uniref:3-oxoacyl-ACP reductase n=1 Tax=Lottiidibacillus patelloidae TaxID=2670334 RepID=A0A263BXA7_9BACI|nr:beta-ketoacyl-ACP reductase [Lottiidibacillus patelloidae]OZM58373.1 3-oxoacyl-ACP reductase [Lottiidibacillus patelloidae]
MRLKDKVAIITGAANGIGMAAAKTFVKEGAYVIVADYNEKAGGDLVASLNAESDVAMFIKVNVADQSSVNEMVEIVREKYKKIDILVNNAGITRDGLLTKLSKEDWQQVIDVNLSGVFYCTQAVAPTMLEQGEGKIILTSSVSGVYGNFGQTNYAATKAGVVGMMNTWAKELGRKGINVNAVAPGFIMTDMVAKMPEKVLGKMREMVPLGRLGNPEDIAKAYLFLASSDADYVNGTVLHVDGGIVM